MSALLVAILVAGSTLLAAPPARAAACTPGEFTVTATHSPIFFSDFGDSIHGMYLGYQITNNGSPIDDFWVTVDNFAGVVGLAANEDGIQHFGPLAAGETVYAYFYVTTSSTSNASQTHSVNMFSGTPIPSNELCDSAKQLSSVQNTISANANKVTAVVNGPNPQELGGLMTITVTGDTGQVGGAGRFAMTPASLLGWPANAYQLTDVTMELTDEGAAPGTGTTYDDTLYLAGLGNQKYSYTIVYTFVAQGTTSGPTAVAPINNINSGNPVKHTSVNTTEYQAIPPLDPPVSLLWLEKAASPSLLPTGGKTVYTVTIHNDGAVDTSIDAFVDDLPATVTFDPTVTPTFNGTPIPAPAINGQELTFSGLFTVSAAGTSTLTYGVDVPNTIGTYVNSVVGEIGPGPVIIDTTRDDLGDVSPATSAVTVGPLEADLGITKTDGVTTVTAGDPTSQTYSITVTNNGPAPSENVVVVDTWPAELTLGTVTPSQGSCSAGPSFTCSLGDLNPGSTATVSVEYTAASDVPAGSVTNTATVTSDTTDPGPTSNTASDTNTVVTDVGFTIAKSFAAASVPAGTSGSTFTVDVTNTGLSDASNVRVTDAVDPSLTVVSVDCDGGTNLTAGNAVECVFGTLAGGAAAAIVVTYDVPLSTQAGTVTNTATVQSDTAGPTSATASVEVTENVILGIVKTFADTTVTAGAGTSHSFDVVVTNTGTTSADNTVVVDAVDSSVTVTGTDCAAQGGIDGTLGNAVECSGLTIGPAGSGTETFTLTVSYEVPAGTDAKTVTNVAQVSSDEQAITDSNLATVDIVEDVALTATKSFIADPVDAGSTGNTFTVAVTNAGTSDADSVVISDVVDPVLIVTSTDCGALGGTDTTVGNTVTCTLPSVAGGATVVLTVTFDVSSSAEPTTVSNTAQILSDEQPSTDSNTTAVAVTEDVLLSVVKTFTTDPVAAGSVGNTFTLAVTNSGLSDADNVLIVDTVDANLTVTATDCAALGGTDSTSGNSVACTLPGIPGGATAIMTVTYDVASSVDASSVVNTATVSSDEQPGTNSNTASVGVFEDVVLTATKAFVDPVVVAGGDPSSFTILVTNTGLSDTENLSIVDTVDAALTVTGTDCVALGGIDGTVANAVDCVLPSLGPGGSITLTVGFLVGSSVDAATVSNTATVSSDEQGPTASNTATVEVVEDVGLEVVKAFTPSAVNGGTSGNQFTITVTNFGSSDATDVVVTDAVDGRLAVTAVDCAGGVNGSSGQDVSCTLSSVPAGGSATVTVTYDVSASQESTAISNTATATDVDGNSASGSGALTVAENVVLAITKLPSPPSVIAGTGGHTFTITVENLGTSDAEFVRVTDSFDPRLTVTNVVCGADTDASIGQDVDCTYDSLAPGASATITVTYDVAGTVADDLVPNTALATDADGNSTTGLGSVEVVTVIDLDAAKQFLPATAPAGSTGNQIRLTVENNGISDATSVVMTDTIDPRLAVTAVDCGGGVNTSSGQTITCTFGLLAAGTSATVLVTYDIASSVAPTTVGNQVFVDDGAGNTATALSSVNLFGSILLSAAKTFSPTSVVAGSTGNQFTITVTNDGLSDTTVVNIIDSVDPRLAVTGVSCPGGINNTSGQDVDCTFASLPAGASVAAVVTYSVAENVDSATVPNVVSVADGNGNVGSAFASVAVRENVSLVAAKSFTEDPVEAGTGPHTFTVAVTNAGISDAEDVVITDTVDAALVVTGVVADSGGTCDPPGAAVRCTIPTLAASAVATVTVTYDAAAGPSSTVTNTAFASSDETLVVATASDALSIVNPSVTITKTANATTVNPGDPVTYTYEVTNNGDVHLSDLEVIDDAGTPGATADDLTIACASGAWPIAPGASVTCAVTVSLAVDTTNTAVVSANPTDAAGNDLPALADVTAAASEFVNVLVTALAIDKSTTTPIVATGDTAFYEYLVENTGDEPLSAIAVTDDRCPSPVFDSEQTGNGDANLDPGEVWLFTCDVAVTADVTNVAFASAIDELGQTVVSATDSVTVDVIDPAVGLTKNADAAQVVTGATVTYTIDVENLGDDPLVNVAVTDDTCSGLLLTGGDGGVAGVLDLGEVWTFTCSTVAGTADIVNVADVTADDSLGRPVTATDSVTVTVNQPPVATDDTETTNLDTPVTTSVLANDVDPEMGVLTVTSVSGVTVGAIVTINPSGTITYTPPPGFTGVDTYTYEVCDDGSPVACDTATVTVTVNAPPAASDDTAATNQDTPVIVDVAANDGDPDGLDLGSVAVLTQPANGTAVVNPNGTVTYTPDPGFFGSDTFTYEICDTLGACTTASVEVNVNGAPTPAPDSGVVDEGESLNLDVIGNDTDPEGDPLTVTGFPSPPLNGSVVIEADGTITYTPDPGFLGIESFTYEVCDEQGACAEASVSISVNGAPVAVDDAAVTSIDTPIAIDVLANDIDPEGALDPATVEVISGPANGTATVDPTTGSVTYLPAPGFVGIDTFEYEVCDDAGSCATAAVTIEVGDPPPLGAPDFAVTDEDTPVTIGVLGNDADPTGQQLFIGGVTQPANGTVIVNPDGTVTYTPDSDFNGEDTFTYLVCDFQPPSGLDMNAPLAEGTSCEEVNVTVTVMAINDAPIFTGASPITIGAGETIPALTASDVDGSTSVFSIIGGALPPGVTLNPDGSFTGTTTVLGTYVFTVQVCDGESPPACSVMTFSLVVQALPTTGSSPAAWAIMALLLLLAGFGVVRLTGHGVAPHD